MTRVDPSRREFLAVSGAAAAVWLGTDPAAFRRALAAARAAVAGQAIRYDVLSDEQAADLDAIASQIIPTDDELPGAHEARVVVFIDRALGSFAAGQHTPVFEGLDDLNRRAGERWPGAGRFATLTPERRQELLREIAETPFFGRVRFAVIVGMFAHPSWGGNYDGAGWRVLDFEPRFVWSPPFGAYDAEAHQ